MKGVIFYYPLTAWEETLSSPYIGYEKSEMKQEALITTLDNFWVKIYFARWEVSYQGKNTFIPQFEKVWNTWRKNREVITADLVLGFWIPVWVSVCFNTMGKYSRDKKIFEAMFPKYSLPSVICNNYSEIEKNFWNIPSGLKVLKPRFWTRGRGIIIQENIPKKEEIEEIHFPYLLQEFFDTSSGFYWVAWIHDFRCVILDGEIIGAYLRQPETWRFTANSFRKWWFIDYTHRKIPEKIIRICSEIDARFRDIKHRYYSIDFWISQNADIKVFEINSAPWLTNSELSEKLWVYIAKNILKVL